MSAAPGAGLSCRGGDRARAAACDSTLGVPVTTPETVLVVVAAGSSSRFGGDKLFAPLGGRTVLERSIAALRSAIPGAPLVLVVRPDVLEQQRAAWEPRHVTVVVGGSRRQDSVRNGVEALSPADDAIVVIHDAARPFVPAADVTAVVVAARRRGAALLVAPVVDTVKRVTSDAVVVGTVPRDDLARALTPQAFRASLLREAWRHAGAAEWTDEAALVESLGQPVEAVSGDPRNLKVTRPEDLSLLAGVFPREVRVGQGIDVHPFQAGRPLWLCGIEFPGEVGLAGHSDADAVLHAVTDAILGACGAGDIGQHFPPTDPKWRDAASELFVRHGLAIAAASGWRVANCDVTVLAEQPRVAPYRAAMRDCLAALLGLPPDAVSVKATTCEGLGFVGRREGIMATAVVTVERQ